MTKEQQDQKRRIIDLLSERKPNYNGVYDGRSEYTLRSNFAVERALLVLTQRQTYTEQNIRQTTNKNGVGFSKAHGKWASFADQIKRSKSPYGFRLSPKQLSIVRKLSSRGIPMIAMYANQLVNVSESKAAVKAATLAA